MADQAKILRIIKYDMILLYLINHGNTNSIQYNDGGQNITR